MPKFDFAHWRQHYKDREIAIADLKEIIKPGSRIYIGSACSEPTVLTEPLVEEMWRYPDSQILHFFTQSNQKFFNEENPTLFRHISWSIIGCPSMRYAVNNGKSDFTPIMLSEVPRLLHETRIPVDIALVQVSPPERNGFCSLGINVDINKAMVKAAKIVVAHVNPEMPRTAGDTYISFENDIDHFVYVKHPLLETPSINPDEIHGKVAQNVARLIENGATLNFGIGKVSYCLPRYLLDKEDLAIYGEVMPESVIELIQDGNVNCSKNYYPHCMTSFILGGKRFYDFVNENPFIEFHTTDYLTNFENMTRNKKLCSIYGALSVDILGQATNHLGTTLYGGTGSEADFVRGSAISRGGKVIVALPSITLDGKSRIVPFLPPGPVELRAIDVHYVVTEWGIAYLHGKTVRERALQMISIAAPQFRSELLEKAKQMKYVYEDQVLPATKDGVVVLCPDIEWKYETKSKGPIHFRPVLPTDERLLQDLYYGLSEKDRRHRFLSQRKMFSHEETQSRIACDYTTSLVIVGTVGEEKDLCIIAEGAYYLEESSNMAEVSITVDKEYRNEGLASHIFSKLIELSQERGISGLFGEIAGDNFAMFHILNSLPFKIIFTERASTFEFTFKFSDKKNDS